MIAFSVGCWHFASSLDWWERGVVTALVGALLFVASCYGCTSLIASFWSLLSFLDLSERGAVGALTGVVLLILFPGYAPAVRRKYCAIGAGVVPRRG